MSLGPLVWAVEQLEADGRRTFWFMSDLAPLRDGRGRAGARARGPTTTWPLEAQGDGYSLAVEVKAAGGLRREVFEFTPRDNWAWDKR